MDESSPAAIADTSLARSVGGPPAEHQNIPRTERVSAKSRHATSFVFRHVGVHPAENSIEFAGGQIAFHLFIPLVVIPRMKAGRDFRPFLQAEVLQRLFDLLNAH